jgi:hypothetical protein
MYTMKESVAVAKEADAKKRVSPTNSIIPRVRDEPEMQLGSLRDVLEYISRDGGTPSVDSIAANLSSMHTAQRAPVLLALQQTHGNRYVQRVVSGIQAKLKVGHPGDKYEQEADRVADEVMRMPEPHKFHIQRACSECEEVDGEDTGQTDPVILQQEETLLQRENGETTTLPSTPEFRLQMPILGGASSPPFSEIHLEVPPLMLDLIEQQLDLEVIRQGLSQIDLGATTVPSPTDAAAVDAPAPEPTPLVPADPDLETTRQGSAGDVFPAIAADPALGSILQGIQTAALDRVRRDWDRLSTGERVMVITAAVHVGGGALAGVLSHSETQLMAIEMLINGRTFPVPGVRGLSVELNLSGENWMVGFHLDVGALLPESWGFGPSSPTAIGGPPTPPERQTESEEEEEPVQPKRGSNQVVPVTADLEERINALRGGGHPLSEAERAYFEPLFGYDFSQVRVHTHNQASQAAQALNARAFTVGQDIFFANREYNPSSTEGRRLLSHELTHTLQQSPPVRTPAVGTQGLQHRISKVEQGVVQRTPDELEAVRTEGTCPNLPGEAYFVERLKEVFGPDFDVGKEIPSWAMEAALWRVIEHAFEQTLYHEINIKVDVTARFERGSRRPQLVLVLEVNLLSP